MSNQTEAVLESVTKERDVQDRQWGGPAHDDSHNTLDFNDYIRDKLRKAAAAEPYWEQRRRYVQIAALAVAAIELIDRREPTNKLG